MSTVYTTRVSEKPIYTDYSEIALGTNVSIIDSNYTKLNRDFHTYSTDDTKFLYGTLEEITPIYSKEGPSEGPRGNFLYKVKLLDKKLPILFPKGSYYFKLIDKPNPHESTYLTGGKRNIRKRNIIKSRKTHKKISSSRSSRRSRRSHRRRY
jgi:hypothetical protein